MTEKDREKVDFGIFAFHLSVRRTLFLEGKKYREIRGILGIYYLGEPTSSH